MTYIVYTKDKCPNCDKAQHHYCAREPIIKG